MIFLDVKKPLPKLLVSNVFVFALLDNDVDGEAFLLLEEADIMDIVSSIGAQRKLIAKRKFILDQKVCS